MLVPAPARGTGRGGPSDTTATSSEVLPPGSAPQRGVNLRQQQGRAVLTSAAAVVDFGGAFAVFPWSAHRRATDRATDPPTPAGLGLSQVLPLDPGELILRSTAVETVDDGEAISYFSAIASLPQFLIQICMYKELKGGAIK